MSCRLGRDVILTLRVPNPGIERDMRKSMVEALQSVPSARDVADSFYGGVEDASAPIQEVILPFTTSAEELFLVEAYYRKVIVGQETLSPPRRPSRERLGRRVLSQAHPCHPPDRGYRAPLPVR